MSEFIKIAQMLTLQYCFEQEEDGDVESCAELLKQLYTRFLMVSTLTPMDWVLQLRLYGRSINSRITAAGCINWVGDIVIYEEIKLSMSDFWRLVHELTDETHIVLLHELLFVKNIGELLTYS